MLSNSTATHIVMKANIREWRHIFSLRPGKGVYPEMRELMVLLIEGSQGKNPRGVRRSGGIRMMTLGSLFSGSGSFELDGDAHRHEGKYPRVAAYLRAASGQGRVSGNAHADGASVEGSQGKNPSGVR